MLGLLLTGTPIVAQESAPAPTNAALQQEIAMLRKQLAEVWAIVKSTKDVREALAKREREADAQQVKQNRADLEAKCARLGMKVGKARIYLAEDGPQIVTDLECVP